MFNLKRKTHPRTQIVNAGTIKKAIKINYGRPRKYTHEQFFNKEKNILENFRMTGNNKVK